MTERRHEISRLEAFSNAAFSDAAVALGGPPAAAPMAPMTFALMGPFRCYGRYNARRGRRAGATQR